MFKFSTPIIAAMTVGAAMAMAPMAAGAQTPDASPASQLKYWSVQAGTPGNAAKGAAFFTTRQGGEWSCASCHGTPPTAQGEHASTGKLIAPLAPAFNPKAFTDTAKSDKWFRRSCNDVLSRECTAAEKADVLAWLISLKP